MEGDHRDRVPASVLRRLDRRVGLPARLPAAVTEPDGELWSDDLVLECEPPHLLSHTWRSLWDREAVDEPASRVTWRIEPQTGGVCKLTVTHDQLEGSPATAHGVSGGWAFIISGLKSLLETDEPLATVPS